MPGGTWQGQLQVPGAQLRIVFDIEVAESGLAAKMASPDQGANNIPVEQVSWKDDTLTLRVGTVGGLYRGVWNKDSLRIAGHWFQSGGTFPLVLKKATGTAMREIRPQDPVRPFPYTEDSVRYPGLSAAVTIGATLTLPAGEPPFPAVILISGSGAQNRDEEIMQHRPFLVLSDYLTRRGIAVLRYDDRGVGESTGPVANATTADFADDALAGFRYLKTRKEIHPAKIGLAGHSEGGLIAPMVYGQAPDIAFMVLMAAPGLPGKQILREQSRYLLRQTGAGEEDIRLALQRNEEIYALVKTSRDSAVLADEIKAILFADPLKQGNIDTTTQNGIVRQYLQPWFRFFLHYDPRPNLEKLRCPVLAINGSKDIQVEAKENLEAIASAIASAGNNKAVIRELPGLNHLFQTAVSGDVSEYAKIAETFSPAALQTIGDWIIQNVR